MAISITSLSSNKNINLLMNISNVTDLTIGIAPENSFLNKSFTFSLNFLEFSSSLFKISLISN